MLVVAAPGWGELVLVATATPLLQLKAETRVKSLWTLHHRADGWSPSTTPSLTASQTERLQLQSDFKFSLLGVLSSHLSLGSESWVGMD